MDGIYEIIYDVGKLKRGKTELDANGNVVYFGRQYTKTVFDTSKVSIDMIEAWAKDAFAGEKTFCISGSQLCIQGEASNGLKFEGWLDPDTGLLKSFYPVGSWGNWL